MDHREGEGFRREQMMARLALAGIIVALAAPAGAADPSVGRLFFTPSQRASLDVARSQRTRATVATERTEEDTQPVPQTITYGGMVRRSDGRTTVWLNDRAIDDRRPAGGPTIIRQVRPDGAVTLEVPQSSRRVDLKVGQSVEVLSGSVGEGYRQRPAAGGDKPTDKDAKDDGAASGITEKAAPRGDGDRSPSEARERAAPQEPRAAGAGSR
jgi:hypothetical protein